MNYKFWLIAILLCLHFGLRGQTPKKSKLHPTDEISLRDCNSRFPGTISFGAISGQSNNGRPDTIFLCYGDFQYIKHNGDGNIQDGDPNPATPSGIGYLLYTCPPTIAGTNYAAISSDCVILNPNPGVDSLWHFMGTPNGDVTLLNDGGVNDFFNNGSPFVMYLAPSTFDQIDVMDGEFIGSFENNGSCIRVNTQQAFPLVYLNQISVNNFATLTPTSLNGSFEVTGGLPEFDPARSYDISMVKIGDASKKAALQFMPFVHDGKVNFSVPEKGNYRITIIDSYNCSTTKDVEIPSGITEVNFTSHTVNQGTQFCVDISVRNFIDFFGGEFTINFDPTKLQFESFNFPTPNPLAPAPLVNAANANTDGSIKFLWTSNVVPFTLPDDEIIMTICFTAIGPPGTVTPIFINKNESASFFDEDNITFNINDNAGIINITQPSNLVLDVQVCSTTSNLGSITITAFGPDAQYNYIFETNPLNILNRGIPITFNNLAPGTYHIRVTSPSTADVVDINVIVNNLPPIDVQSVLTDPKCFNGNDGTINLNITGGTQPYAIEWSNFNFNTNTLTNLENGLYSVTITDAEGCRFIENYPLNAAPIVIDPPVLVQPVCSGITSGSVFISVSGGTPLPGGNYNFSWSGGSPFNQNNVVNSTYQNLKEGNYFVTVTDGNSCQTTATFELNPGSTLSVDIDEMTLFEPQCVNDLTGHIFVSGLTDGVSQPPYTFNWSANIGTMNNTPNSSELSNLAAGIYTVTISNGNGCSATETVSILGVPKLDISFLGIFFDNCNSPTPTGGVQIIGFGGTPFVDVNGGFYEFEWSDGTSTFTGSGPNLNISNLSGDGDGITYTIKITDAMGCVSFKDVVIFKDKSPTLEFDTLQTISCMGGNIGSIQAKIKANGGKITSVVWSQNAGTSVETGDVNNNYFSTISNLSEGEYIVTVTSENGCSISDTILLEAEGSINISNEVLIPPSCHNTSNGSITLNPTGGVPPYSFEWSNSSNSSVITGLQSGIYIVTISDNSGCNPIVRTYNLSPINPPITLSILPSSIIPASCGATQGDGGATVFASGGVGNTYDFIWSSGETFFNTNIAAATQLNEGMQSVTVTDGFCNQTLTVDIPSPNTIVLNSQNHVIQDVTCFGLSDGSISVNVTGGVGQLTYSWSNNVSQTNMANSLMASGYFVTVTDQNNCQRTAFFTINEPDILQTNVFTNDINNVTCFGLTDGSASVTAVGGNSGGYSYTWNPSVGTNQPTINQLSAGNYFVTVTDQKGCFDSSSFTIIEPQILAFQIDDIPTPTCFGSATIFSIQNVTGGTGRDYTYSINELPFQSIFEDSNVYGGSNKVTVKDENDCTISQIFNISQPLPVIVSLDEEYLVNLGDSVIISPVISSVFPISEIEFSPITYLSCGICDYVFATPIEDSQVNVLVTDVNGCIGIDSTTVRVDKSRKVFIPNVFTPNNDGINDRFQIFTGPGVEKIVYFRVFDRFGAIVYEANNLDPSVNGTDSGWNGIYKGQELNSGVFAFVTQVKFIDQKIIKYFGDITLVK